VPDEIEAFHETLDGYALSFGKSDLDVQVADRRELTPGDQRRDAEVGGPQS
jgi:hypothetical protein